MLTRGMNQDAIAAALGRTKATINWHARRMSVVGSPYAGRAFVVRVLGYSGVRNSELCDLRIGQVRLHDRGGARFHIPDAKTEGGVRVVETSPDLAEAFVDHLDRLRRAGSPTGLDTTSCRTRVVAVSAANASPRSSAKPRRWPARNGSSKVSRSSHGRLHTA